MDLLLILAFTLSFNTVSAKSEKECFEKVSRGIFKFNKGFDNLILKPIAKGYNKLPEPIKKGTGNFTSNIATLLSIPNYLLQGELESAGDATGSFLINTTVGILGLGNPAASLGFEAQKEDLGQTLEIGINESTTASAEQIQETQSIESVGTVYTETTDRAEKILPKTTPEKQYEFAVSFIKVGDYETAELALREFVDNNAEHDLAGNAQYWYGETFRVRQLYQDAATAYLNGYQKYPKSSKAPVNLLKLGVMLVQIGEKEQGCTMILGVKDQYPKANQSVIQKAEYEKKKFNCEKNS